MNLRSFAASVTLGLTLALPVAAAPSAAELAKVLRLEEVIGIIHDEGLSYAQSIEREMFPSGGGQLWDMTVQRLYDTDTMHAALQSALGEEMSSEARDETQAFFDTDRGQSILTFENAARSAMADPDVEEVARAAYEELREVGSARLDQIDRFVAANDLIERNVAGALSSNYQFFRGLVDGGAFVMSEEDILSDVYGQEPEVREETESWIFAFLLLAYQPLSDEVLEAYIAFSETEGGRELNAALFEGFERMYRDVSYRLGLAASAAMAGSDL